ncbi:MAG: hypothetical protein R6U95_02440, partial [Bacteroidales bacterium]
MKEEWGNGDLLVLFSVNLLISLFLLIFVQIEKKCNYYYCFCVIIVQQSAAQLYLFRFRELLPGFS